MAKLKIKNILYRIYKTVFYFFIIVFLLLIGLFIAINTPYVKNTIAQEAIKFLNKELKTSFEVKNVEIDYFGNVVLHKVSVKDQHNYKFMKIEKATAYLDFIALIKNLKNINIKYIKLEKPEIRIITYKGENTDNFSLFTKTFASDNKEPSTFKLGVKIDLIDGMFSIENQNLEENEKFWLDTHNLNIKVKKLQINGSIITADLTDLSFLGNRHKENYSLKLSGDILYSDTLMNFKDINLKTGNSNLKGNLSFKYKGTEELADFANKVKWNLNINESDISGKDIRYFTNQWDNDKSLSIKGRARGTLSNLLLTDLKASGHNTVLHSESINLKGIAGKSSLTIQLKSGRLQTSYNSLQTWLPNFIKNKMPKELEKFGTANYNGNFSLNPNELKVQGSLISSIGKVDADISLKGYNKNVPSYKGYLIAHNINLSSIIDNNTIGSVYGRIDFDGKGFSLNNLDTKFDSRLSKIVIQGKNISPISASGEIKNKTFVGNIISKDPHANLVFDGSIDFSSKRIKSSFDSTINYLDLEYLGIMTEKNPILKGEVYGDIEFTNIKDITGNIVLSKLNLKTKNKEVEFSDIEINTSVEEDMKRNFDIYSPNMITANIYGYYNLDDIPEMFKNGIGNLMISYKPKKNFKDQDFTFVLDLQKSLFDLFMLDMDMSSGTTITGNYSSNDNTLNAQVISDYIKYKNILVQYPILYLSTNNPEKQLEGNIKYLSIDSTYFSDLHFTTNKKNDSLLGKLDFNFGKDEAISKYDLSLYQIRDNGNIVFGFLPSKVDINESQWLINPNSLDSESSFTYNVNSKKLSINNFSATSDLANIQIDGIYESTNDFAVDLNLNKVDILKLIPKSLLKNVEFAGMLNGNTKFQKQKGHFTPLANLNIDDFVFNKDLLGDLLLYVEHDTNTGGYVITSILDYENRNRLLVNGGVNFVNNEPIIDLKINASELNLSPIGVFLFGIFSNFRGLASGDINVKGSLKNLDYEGMISVKDFGFTVDYLGVDYQTKKTENIPITNGSIMLNNIEIFDTKENTNATVSGLLSTKNFTSWAMDIALRTNGALVLNTTSKQNDLFYGKVIASGMFNITGPTDNLLISANAKTLPGSIITLNSSSTQTAGKTPYLTFIPSGNPDVAQKVETPKGLTINATINATPDSQVNIIINEQTGDKIEARGTANRLKFNMSNTGKITMDGEYIISDDSKYYFKTLLDKEFEIEPNSKITWLKGSPTDAELDITASYARTVTNLNDYLDTPTAPAIEALVQVRLSEKLSKPKIDLDVKANGLSGGLNEDLKSKLNNEDEKKNQAVAILLTGKFMANEKLGSAPLSNVYEIFIKQALQFINNISSDVNINVEITPGAIGSGETMAVSDRLKTSVDVKLSNRINISGAVGMPLAQKNVSDVWTAEGKIEYDISKEKDKSLVFTGFSKPTTFGIENIIAEKTKQSYGAGILMRSSFDNFSELFEKKKNTDKARNTSTIDSVRADIVNSIKIRNDSIKKVAIKSNK